MNTTLSSHDRALVLGGGGSTGNAWMIGVIAGLFEAGLDVTSADLIVGTSAGATAAAQIAGAHPAQLYEQTLTFVPPRPSGPSAPSAPSAGRPAVTGVQRVQAVIDASSDMADMRRRMSASALELDAASDGEWSARWRSIVVARLPQQEWPERRVLITAVDARTAEPVVFDRDSGVTLADAVAASTSSAQPLRIGDGRYIDGGYRVNAENADLAAGYERVLVLSPFGGRSLAPASWGTHLAAQVEALRSAGSRVEVIGPESEELHGANAMDASLRPAAARAGHAQGLALAPTLAAFWR
jgi:NTE family protein